MAGIVAIGASRGGVDALQKIASALPADFPAPILIVLHIGSAHSMLPSILAEAGPLEASHAAEGDAVRPGHILIAPPDRHMVVDDGRVRLSRSPRENWTRPAIDPLFRSVARNYGPDAIGVILTGMLNDGTAGLFEIKRLGGTAIVQDPAQAESSSMPRSAMENVAVDYCLKLEEIAPALVRLTAGPERRRESSGVSVMTHGDQRFSVPVAQTCPECGGAMREDQLGTLTQFRCHIGHVMTAEVLAAAKLEMLEGNLSSCVRAIHERGELCLEIARKCEALDNAPAAARWRKAGEEAEARARAMAEFAEQGWYHPEQNGEQAEAAAGLSHRA